MVCTANDLLGWKDFPKGLRVLLLDEESSSAAEIKSKLEEMDYIVFTFYNENEALSAVANKSESFHVAIVEVSTDNSDGRFKFLESAKDLPTIMTSNMDCLNTMMKCIALGAVEFLRKPLCEEKLRNIWQHVVHKAFNAGEKDLYLSVKPIKESVLSMLEPKLLNGDSKKQISIKAEHAVPDQENSQELPASCDKYPAPSTPQLNQGLRSLDDGDCPDQTNFSSEKDSMERDGECKSVETTCGNSIAEATVQTSPKQRAGETFIKQEDESADCSNGESNISSQQPENKDLASDFHGSAKNLNKASQIHNSNGMRTNRKKTKVDWTTELHKKFVQAVEQLGVDHAIPSRILELMKVEGLTRHNVASHLQKYRMHRRHILPKGENHRSAQRNYHHPNKPIMAFPPYHSNHHALPAGQVYPAWGPPGSYPASFRTWGPPFYPAWHTAENWHWKPYSGPTYLQADAWGCPVMPPPLGSCPSFSQNALGFQNADTMQNERQLKSFDHHPAEDVIDEVVKEAINKPWLPLPLGLKPPSADSVLAELSKQGISAIPPHRHHSDGSYPL